MVHVPAAAGNVCRVIKIVVRFWRGSIQAATHGSSGPQALPAPRRRTTPQLGEIVQSARPTRALLRVDPRLLDDERLPQARGDAFDLIVGVGLRVADSNRVR